MKPYRAIPIGGKDFVFGWYAEEDNVSGILNNPGDGNPRLLWNEVIPETVGQSTGLKDKNGKPIYEGDKIKHPRYSEGHLIVQWDVFGWGLFWTMCNEMWLDNSEECEVIGNIHQEAKE